MRPASPEPAPGPGLVVIGRKEYLDFPEWGVRRVRVKVDTGARTSALDVAGWDVEPGPDGPVALVRLSLDGAGPRRVVEVRTSVLGTARVRCTAGGCEHRPVIEALVALGPVRKRIRLTLTNRSAMRHRMILGRQALTGSFLVDVGRQYLLRRHKG
jgi:hypothetical protein